MHNAAQWKLSVGQETRNADEGMQAGGEKALSLLIANEEKSGKTAQKWQRHVGKRIKASKKGGLLERQGAKKLNGNGK